MARLKAIIAIILLVGLSECARDLTKCEIGKEDKYLKKKPCKFQRVGSKCAKADVQFSSELIYVLQFSQHFKATKLRAHET